MASKHQLSTEELNQVFAKTQIQQSIIDAMDRPAEKKPWYVYRPIFVTEKRAKAGANFWKKHAATLAKASAQYGVPAEIIVSLIGVETFYGQITGNYSVMDALSTLTFSYPRRAPFFRKELENFLLLSREQNWDPNNVKGSYAGAMGYGQFMPSSYRAYAVDYNGTTFSAEGYRDLFKNPDDAIGSVANYLAENGWKADQSIIVIPATYQKNTDLASLANADLKTTQSLDAWAKQNIRSDAALPGNMQANLVLLDNQYSQEVWLGLHNFYIITKYNRSPLYAMAVYQLSGMIKKYHQE